MYELMESEVQEVSAGKFKIRINIGTFIGGAIVGFITGGPIGLGYALGAAIIAQSVNSLDDMYTNNEPY